MKKKYKALAYYYFQKQKRPTTKDVLAAHIMISKQIWAFSKK